MSRHQKDPKHDRAMKLQRDRNDRVMGSDRRLTVDDVYRMQAEDQMFAATETCQRAWGQL